MIVLTYKSDLLMIFDRSIHSAHYIKTTDTAREPSAHSNVPDENEKAKITKTFSTNTLNQTNLMIQNARAIKLYPNQPTNKTRMNGGYVEAIAEPR